MVFGTCSERKRIRMCVCCMYIHHTAFLMFPTSINCESPAVRFNCSRCFLSEIDSSFWCDTPSRNLVCAHSLGARFRVLLPALLSPPPT